MLSNILNIYCKNIFNNFLIAESCRTRIHLFKKLPSPAPAPAPVPESRNAPVLHRTQQSLSPKIWVGYGSLTYQIGSAMWILFLYSILSEVTLSVTSLIDMSFFITSTNVIFDLCLPFFFSFPRLGSTHYFSSYEDVGKNLCRTHKHVNTNTSNHVSASDNNKLTKIGRASCRERV